MQPRFHNTALMFALFAYLLLGAGGAVQLGFCFEADGRVAVEVMAAGSCSSPHDAAETMHASHCVECRDVAIPLETVPGRKPVALPPVIVAFALLNPFLSVMPDYSEKKMKSGLPDSVHHRLSTIVLLI